MARARATRRIHIYTAGARGCVGEAYIRHAHTLARACACVCVYAHIWGARRADGTGLERGSLCAATVAGLVGGAVPPPTPLPPPARRFEIPRGFRAIVGRSAGIARAIYPERFANLGTLPEREHIDRAALPRRVFGARDVALGRRVYSPDAGERVHVTRGGTGWESILDDRSG